MRHRSGCADPEFERLSPVVGGLLVHCGAWRQAWPLLSDVLAAETLSPLGRRPLAERAPLWSGETDTDVELQLASWAEPPTSVTSGPTRAAELRLVRPA